MGTNGGVEWNRWNMHDCMTRMKGTVGCMELYERTDHRPLHCNQDFSTAMMACEVVLGDVLPSVDAVVDIVGRY